jgi:hypothetical protein
MCAADAPLATIEPRIGSERFDDIVVVGGGCYGGYYVRQLQRAARVGRISARRIVVVDHDAECAVARSLVAPSDEPPTLPVDVRVEDWRSFFGRYLTLAATARLGGVGDAIVPSPLMPHLMAEWLVSRARQRWPGRVIDTRPLERTPVLPWQRAGDDGTHYVSFADWICPINCVEPRTCPHTRGPRDWSLPTWMTSFVDAERRATGAHVEGVALHCRHRVFGVGMFNTGEVVAADDAIARLGQRGAGEMLIGTVSHCHGALTRLVIGPHDASNRSPVH